MSADGEVGKENSKGWERKVGGEGGEGASRGWGGFKERVEEIEEEAGEEHNKG